MKKTGNSAFWGFSWQINTIVAIDTIATINAISKTEIPKTLLFSSLQTIAEATYLEIVAMGVAFGEEDYLGGVSVEICDLAGAIRQPDELHFVVDSARQCVL